MSFPLVTVPQWVPNIIKPKILFITENYPKDPDARTGNTYFYRTLNKEIQINGANNLLNNLAKAMQINGASEFEKLQNFLFRHNYYLIDTLPAGHAFTNELVLATKVNQGWLDQVINDITFIDPEQIVFTCIRSNGKLLPELKRRAIQRGISIFNTIVSTHFDKTKQVFNSPSNRAFPGFKKQIQYVIQNGTLKA